jgi:hypothetical protein
LAQLSLVAGTCNQRWLRPMNPGGTHASLIAGERNQPFPHLIERRISRLLLIPRPRTLPKLTQLH